MDNFIYIPIKNNTKESAVKWKHLKATHPLTTKFENRAILTGSLSNIVAIDNEYLIIHGEPETLKSKYIKQMKCFSFCDSFLLAVGRNSL